MGIVRGNGKGLGQHPFQIPGHALANPLQHVRQQRGARALHRAGTDLLAVKRAQYRHRAGCPRAQKAPSTAPDAFQIVQRGGGNVLPIRAPDGRLLPDIEIQVVAQNFPARLPFQFSRQPSGAVFSSQQRQHIHRRIPMIPVVDLPVHVNGDAGNQQKVPVNIHQAVLHAPVRFHRNPPGNRQRPVQPGMQNLPAVAFHRHPKAGPVQFKVLLDLKAGSVQMAGTHQEACRLPFRDSERRQSRAAPLHIVFSAGRQTPVRLFRQAGIAPLFQCSFQKILRVIDAVRGVQKCPQALNLFLHCGLLLHFSLKNRLLMILHQKVAGVNRSILRHFSTRFFEKVTFSYNLITDCRCLTNDCCGFHLQITTYRGILLLSHMAVTP